MSTWLDAWDRRYTERVRRLVEILPVLAQEPNFALKGGTAINLFERDLPRLSVDIDLTRLPTRSFAEDSTAITQSLLRLCSRPLQTPSAGSNRPRDATGRKLKPPPSCATRCIPCDR